MLDIFRNNKRITQGFLALITLPFAFWGVESYVRNASDGAVVATVGDSKIGAAELQNALREQQDRMRKQLGARMDPAMFDTPQMRQAVLDSLVNQRLMSLHAQKSRMTVGDGQLAQFIASVPSLQENGKFSKERYDALLASQGLSAEGFEARLRQDMAMQQLVQPVTDAGIVGQMPADRWISGQLEQREIAEIRLLPEAFVAKVSLPADAAQKYYDANRKQFEVPEQVRAEFVVLSKEALLAQLAVSDDEVKARYEARADRYKEPESRRASHILIPVAKDAPEAAVTAAKAKVDDVLGQVKKAPADFSRLATQYSQDPGSAKNGGDLNWFSRGAMVKQFEDAAFALKDGQVSDVVRSDFGFHIIRLTGIRAERVKPLAEVRPQILAELKAELSAKKYADAVEQFGNTVYEQADSLKPAADKWALAVKRSDWLSKGSKLAAPFDDAKLATALFGDDAIKNKRNTQAMEVAPGTMVAARVVEHKPAALLSFESVKADIEKRVTRDEALKLATKEGEATLERLKKGEAVDLKWPATRTVSRMVAQGVSPDAVRAIFKADAEKLPAHAGVALAGNGANGFVLYRISGVKKSAPAKDDPQVTFLSQQYARLVAEEEFAAWMAVLKDKYPVEINKVPAEAK
jgi:peptidyl-prolyl cis-trans isomerase D